MSTPEIDTLITRLDVAEARLAGLSRMPFPPGQTDPDPGAEETWGAAQVWAHVAEFVGYWTTQARAIVDAAAAATPAFGRLKTDAGRVGAIERDRSLPRDKLWQQAHEGIESARSYFGGLSAQELARTGSHQVRGIVDVRYVLEEFVVKHLEEHAAQLDKLASEGAEA